MTKKKVITAVSVTVAAAVLVTAVFFGVRGMKIRKFRSADIILPDNFTVTAHTGCADTEENSLDSILKGVEDGAEIVEFDLYFTENGDPVLAHDEPVGNEVTLDEAFEYISEFEDIRVNVDVKTCDFLEKVYPTAKKYGIEKRIFYTGIGEEDVETVKKDSPEVMYYLNVDVDKSKNTDEKYLLSLVETVKNAGAVGINFNYKSASEELVEIFHENGLEVSIWTVNSEYDMYKILSFEPDNITTRNPRELNAVVREFR